MAALNVGSRPFSVFNSAAGQGPALLINLDLTNTLYVDFIPEISVNSIAIGPLNSMSFDGSQTLYAACFTATVVLLVIPGGTGWTASPAQISEQISALGLATESTQQLVKSNTSTTAANVSAVNSTLGTPAQDGTVSGVTTAVGQVKSTLGTPAQDGTVSGVTTAVGQVKTTLGTPAQDGTVGGVSTAVGNLHASGKTVAQDVAASGVPLLTADTQVTQHLNVALTAGNSDTYGPFTVSQIGYDAWFSVYNTTVPGTYGSAEVSLAWIDSATSQTLATESWWIGAGENSANPHVVVGKGASKANTVQVTITANAENITFSLMLFQNSRIYLRDDWRSMLFPVMSGALSAPTGQDVPGLTLANRTLTSHGIGATDNCLLPLYAGRVRLTASTASVTSDMSIIVSDSTDQNVAGSIIGSFISDSNGHINTEISLPRANCQVACKNGNAAAQNQSWTVVMEEY